MLFRSDSLSRLIERGQVVSAVTLKTYVEQDEAMKAAGGAAPYLARLAAAALPGWLADHDPLLLDQQITDDERDLIKRWYEAGAPLN